MTDAQAPRPFDKLRVAPSDAEGRQGSGQAEGVVVELLPSQLVKVELEGRHTVIAHVSEPVHRNFIRVLVGDRVRVALLPGDRTRGRVVEKL